MHPDLLNNPTFQRYYDTWQRDPKSIVFAPLAEFFCEYKLFADARRVCESGVKYHPQSILAHYSLAKTYTFTREWHAARHEAQWVLAKIPNHQGALDVLQKVEHSQAPVRHVVVAPAPKNFVKEHLSAAIEAAGGSSISVESPQLESVTGPVIEGNPVSAMAATGPHPSTPPVKQSTSSSVEQKPKPLAWQTVTMAKIYAQQGHYFKARTIFKTILSRDPKNTEAQAGLASLERTMRDVASS